MARRLSPSRASLIIRRVKRLLLVLCLGMLLSGCSLGIDLPPEFAARADELPMDVPAGFFPPAELKAGPYEVYDIRQKKQSELRLVLGPVSAQVGGTWTLKAKVRGGAEATIVCVGPPEYWDPDRTVDIKVGRTALGCQMKVKGEEWSFLYGVELDQSMDLPGWVKALSRTQPQKKTDKRDLDAIVVGPESKSFTVEWAHQTVRIAGQGGYFVYLDGVQVGAIDVTALGAPKLYLARDTPEAMVPAVVTAMLTAYLVSGVIPR